MFAYAFLILLPAVILAAEDYTALENKLFSAQDSDGDGKVSKAEAEKFFGGFDADKDGFISEAEFKAALDKLDNKAFAGAEDKLYALLDRNNDQKVNNVDIDAVFELTDANKDGFINKSEFHKAVSDVVVVVG